MATPLRVPIVPQPPAGPSLSLIDAALTPTGEVDLDGKPVDDRWEAGFAWTTRQASVVTGRNDCGTVATVTYRTGAPVKRTHQPVIVTAVNDGVTTLGANWDYQRETAEAALIAAEPAAAELELWEGPLARAAITAGDDAYNGNLWLTKYQVATDLTSSVAATPARGVGILEAFLAAMGYGSAGMIHLPPALLVHLEPGLTRVGQKLYTARGTLVVPGVGYTGSGPATSSGGAPTAPTAGQTYAYATGLVTYRRGEIVVTPDTEAEAVHRAVNRLDITAERSTAGTWDSPAVGSALIALPA